MTRMPHGGTQPTAREQQLKPTTHNHQLQPLGIGMQCRNWIGKHSNSFPRREVGQRSSTANSGEEYGEPSIGNGPTDIKLRGVCESWLSLVKTRSHLVSPRNGKVNAMPSGGNSSVNNHHYHHYQAISTKQNATGRRPPNVAGPIVCKQTQPTRIQGNTIIFIEEIDAD